MDAEEPHVWWLVNRGLPARLWGNLILMHEKEAKYQNRRIPVLQREGENFTKNDIYRHSREADIKK